MHDLIVTPFLDKHLVLYPGHPGGLALPEHRSAELAADGDVLCPDWLADVVARSRIARAAERWSSQRQN